MKTYTILILLILTSILLDAQNIPAEQDTLLSNPESVIDTLQIITEEPVIDSIQTELIRVPTREDSIAANMAAEPEVKIDDIPKIDPVVLNEAIEKVIEAYTNTRKQVLPYSYYAENYHHYWPLCPEFQIKKYGFTEKTFGSSTLQTWQNYLPDNRIIYKNGLMKIVKSNYDQLPMVSIANLVLGEDDMNHAMIRLMKGSILGLKNLNFEASYMAQQGVWLGDQEESGNSTVHLFYNHAWGVIHYNFSKINQKISLQKSIFGDEQIISGNDFSSQRNYEHSFRIQNKYLVPGFRYKKSRFAGTIQETYQYLINKYLDFEHTKIDLSAEYLQENTEIDTSFTIFSMEHVTNLSFGESNNNVQYFSGDNYMFNSFNEIKVFQPIGVLLKYSANIKPEQKDFIKQGAGIALYLGKSNIELTAGLFNKNGFETSYAEAEGMLKLPMGNYQLSYRFWALSLAEEQDYYPTWQNRNTVELGYDLKRDNYLRVGISEILCSEFFKLSETGALHSIDGFILDAYFALQITRNFEFQLDAKNLLSQSRLFGFGDVYNSSEPQFPGIHFNASVSWIFLN